MGSVRGRRGCMLYRRAAGRFITSPSRWLFLQNLMNWVDFVAVLPFFLEQIIGAVEAGQESGPARATPTRSPLCLPRHSTGE